MSITEQQLQRIMPNARRQAGVFVSALNVAMANRQIDTPKRQAAFLAQVGHESGQLQYVRELGAISTSVNTTPAPLLPDWAIPRRQMEMANVIVVVG